MSESTANLRKKISSAGDLQSVVRTMKAVAASNVAQYEQSVHALDAYYRTVEIGLGACFRDRLLHHPTNDSDPQSAEHEVKAIVFGSDQGLVGRFNEMIADFAIKTLASLPEQNKKVWVVGQRVRSALADKLTLAGALDVPASMHSITPLVTRILVEGDNQQDPRHPTSLYLFYNCPQAGSEYSPTSVRLLPLDKDWRKNVINQAWPTGQTPDVIDDAGRQSEVNPSPDLKTLRAFLSEYLFVSIFRACAQSLASENASRLGAMQRAEKNIEELLEDLNSKFHRNRQNGIDEELFDVLSGFEALKKNQF